MTSLDEKIATAQKLLPAWFAPHMMKQDWTYGLMLPNGHVIAVRRINEVTRAVDGTLWLDVTLAPADDYWGGNYDPGIFGAPSARRSASINVAHVAAAFDLVDHQEDTGHG
jgi:hypothetical protein